jgi:ABC-type multidrug transport system ATPase subunit
VQDGSGRIVVQNLTKHFGQVAAVQNLSFHVEPGSVTGFLGPNGSGKTTTLRMLLGLVRPTSGWATINGEPFNRLGNPARVVGGVLEAQGFHPGRTARDHLRVYAAAMGVHDQRADEVLNLVGLGAAGNRAAGGFSLGMKQRLALATALIGDPQVLVLDEPANGLDPEGIAWLRAFLKAFAQSGRTVLISSHLLAEVEQTIDQVVIISRGQTMYAGSLDELRKSQQSRVIVQPADAGRQARRGRRDDPAGRRHRGAGRRRAVRRARGAGGPRAALLPADRGPVHRADAVRPSAATGSAAGAGPWLGCPTARPAVRLPAAAWLPAAAGLHATPGVRTRHAARRLPAGWLPAGAPAAAGWLPAGPAPAAARWLAAAAHRLGGAAGTATTRRISARPGCQWRLGRG